MPLSLPFREFIMNAYLDVLEYAISHCAFSSSVREINIKALRSSFAHCLKDIFNFFTFLDEVKRFVVNSVSDVK
ncbi:unnamed protein product [Cuscuta campestris]|uniref:Exocyst subunit Exo70 family protein n=1 Tax=Cuscuta campestris TaxID=132261 RepID=A0A484MF49_9ASTE|nr:unnamed protein product [Cuscuta campestris]